MKKLFIILIPFFTLISTAQIKENLETINELKDNGENAIETVYNDGKETVTTVYKDIKSLSPKIEEALKELANALKTTSEELWHILINQQLVWSLGYLFLFLISLGVGFKFINFIYPLLYNDKVSDGEVFYAVLLGITFTILSVMSSMNFMKMLTGFINPEFGALKTILDVMSQLK